MNRPSVAASEPDASPTNAPTACSGLAGMRLDEWCACGHLVTVHSKRDGRLGCDICQVLTELRALKAAISPSTDIL